MQQYIATITQFWVALDSSFCFLLFLLIERKVALGASEKAPGLLYLMPATPFLDNFLGFLCAALADFLCFFLGAVYPMGAGASLGQVKSSLTPEYPSTKDKSFTDMLVTHDTPAPVLVGGSRASAPPRTRQPAGSGAHIGPTHAQRK